LEARRVARAKSQSAQEWKSITTIEGLEKEGLLHPVQQAFLDAGAFQCAFCTPGMIISSVALLHAKPNPTSSEIIQFLQGISAVAGRIRA